jgi:hypothetical protein
MGKIELTRIAYLFTAALIIGICIIAIMRGCKKPVTNPAVERLQTLNDSLYQVISTNNNKTDSLFAKIDSLAVRQDTIIQHQEIKNEYYRNETYQILSSSPSAATAQFRTTLKKSDSLLKAGFYTRTYNLRSATFQSQLQ